MTFCSPPKQSTQQIMPSRDDLRSLHGQLEEIVAALELSPTAQQILSDPQTHFQQRLQRDLARLQAVRGEVAHAMEVIANLLSPSR